MTWPKKNFSELQYVDFCDFRRFSGILDGNMNFTKFFTRITKIRFFFSLAQWLLSCKHIQKPEVKQKYLLDQTNQVFAKLTNELCFLTNKPRLSRETYLKTLVQSCLGSNLQYLIHFHVCFMKTTSRSRVSQHEIVDKKLILISNQNTVKQSDERRFNHLITTPATNTFIAIITTSRRMLATLAVWSTEQYLIPPLGGCSDKVEVE